MPFVANHQILVASLMANELIDDWRSSHKQGMTIKLDLKKVFNEVDWGFIDTVL